MPRRPTRSIVSSAKNSATTIPATANVTPMIALKTLFCSDTPGTSAIASGMVRTVTVGTAASICVASRSGVVPSSGVTSTAWNVPGATAASGLFAFSVSSPGGRVDPQALLQVVVGAAHPPDDPHGDPRRAELDRLADRDAVVLRGSGPRSPRPGRAGRGPSGSVPHSRRRPRRRVRSGPPRGRRRAPDPTPWPRGRRAPARSRLVPSRSRATGRASPCCPAP